MPSTQMHMMSDVPRVRSHSVFRASRSRAKIARMCPVRMQLAARHYLIGSPAHFGWLSQHAILDLQGCTFSLRWNSMAVLGQSAVPCQA
eukprot:12817238-Alexandrium_andersonii.AAC.1